MYTFSPLLLLGGNRSRGGLLPPNYLQSLEAKVMKCMSSKNGSRGEGERVVCNARS